jgi:hypothetical protein
MNNPTTKEEAQRQVYGPHYREAAYDERRCVSKVWPATGWGSYQCSRKPGHGPAQLYCRQHAEVVGRYHVEV